MAKIFFSYSHDDETHRDQLEKHLSALKHEGLIESWHDRRLLVGAWVDKEIDEHLEEADMVLLLVSASFLASNYCYGIEMSRALQRHTEGKCQVIPVIVRACEWSKTIIGKLLAVPRDGKPITLWGDYDEAMTDVAREIRRRVEASTQSRRAVSAVPPPQAFQAVQAAAPAKQPGLPRSSNLRLRNDFTDADKDTFLHETFDYLARFFEGSLQELQARHEGVEGRFRRIDADTFTAVVYRHGKNAAECTIRIGGPFGVRTISYSNSVSARGSSANNMLGIEHDDLVLYWKSAFGSEPERRMSKEQAAEYFWTNLMQPLQ